MARKSVKKVEAHDDEVRIWIDGERGYFRLRVLPTGTPVWQVGAEIVAASIRRKGDFEINDADAQQL